MHAKHGFTVTELTIVFVILGILAALAIPKFMDLTKEYREEGAVKKMAASLSSANETNSAVRKKNHAKGVAVSNCTDVAAALQPGALPAGYKIQSAAVAVGATNSTCTVTGPGGQLAPFAATGIR